jgi:uncharacterized protein (TIRG00374 family)
VNFIKRFTLPLLLIIGIFVFCFRVTDLAKLITLLQQGTGYIVIISILLAVLAFLFQAEIMRSLYDVFDIHPKIGHMITLMAGMNVANFIVPSIGFSGVTIFIADAKKRNIKPTTALTVNLLYYLFYYLAFGSILLLSLIYLFSTTHLTSYEILASVIFFIIIFLFCAFIITTAYSLKHSIRLLTFLVAFANTPMRWLTRKSLIKKPKIEEVAENMYHNLLYIKRNKIKLILPIFLSFATHIIAIIMLGYIFIAFDYTITLAIILVGFSMAVLFSLISITPNGVGFVEGAMVVAFRSVGVPVEMALVVTFIFRGLTFWLPFIGGLVALKKLHSPITDE